MKTPEEYFNDQIELPESGKRKNQFSPSEHEFLQKYLGVDQDELLRRLDLMPQQEGEAASEEPKDKTPAPGVVAEPAPQAPQPEAKPPAPVPPPEDEVEPEQEKPVPSRQEEAGIPLDQPVEEQEEDEQELLAKELQLVSFFLGDQEFAVPINRVQEVIRRVEAAKLPTAPSFMDGIINLRGRLTPLIYLRKLIGLENSRGEEHRFIIICRYGDFQIGLLVSRVATMYRMTQENIEWNIDSQLGGGAELLTGLIKNDEKLIGIVDVKRLVDKVLKRTGEADG